MAGMRKLKGRYFARVYIPQPGRERAREKLIGLGTDSKVMARHRKREVEIVEDEIKAGQEFVFSWENDSRELEHKQLKLSKAVERYLKARCGDGLRNGTIKIYETALKDFQRVAGKSLPVDQIGLKHINRFKTKYIGGLSTHSMNIKLRAIKTFLIWLRDNDLVNSVPKIKMLNTGKSLPIYLTNIQFDNILKALPKLKLKENWRHYAEAFTFYRDTGLRLSEPFYGVINGDFLTIEADTAKGHAQRDIHLTAEQKRVLLDMRTRIKHKVTNNGSSVESAIKHYSRVFQYACRKAKITGRKFHCLRHTAAVRLYLVTRDIYKVMKQLGHSSVTTTEIYSKFDVRRLEQDFPDLVRYYQVPRAANPEKTVKINVSDTDLTDTRFVAKA